MVEPFNALNIDVSCLGNHELDHGIKMAESLIAKTNCPWLMSNLHWKDSGEPICSCKKSVLVEHQGKKFGCLGFAEEAWLDCMTPEIPCDKMQYTDYN